MREVTNRNTKSTGIISELVAITRFASAGFRVCVPFGDNAPYDLIVENAGAELFRIQVKTGWIRQGVIMFGCCSIHAHRKRPPTTYVGKIDAFAVYCPENDGLYVVPIDSPAVTSSKGSLRLIPPTNNMKKFIHWANDYRFDENNPDLTKIGVASSSGAAGED